MLSVEGSVTPFPGMDPYVEHPILWEGFHGPFAAELRSQLNETLPMRYIASIETRCFTEVPQLEIKERYIEILDRYEEMHVVTVIESVSPSNKRPGDGRDAYVTKQRATLTSETHLVEIDLLRKGQHVVAVPESMLPDERPFEYLISVNRWPSRRRFELYPIQLQERLPRIDIPLVDPDPDAAVDLQAVLVKVYQDARYMLRVRYDQPCEPPLTRDQQEWADECWVEYRQARSDLFPAG